MNTDLIAVSLRELRADLDRVEREREILQRISLGYQDLLMLRVGPGVTVTEEPPALLEGPKPVDEASVTDFGPGEYDPDHGDVSESASLSGGYAVKADRSQETPCAPSSRTTLPVPGLHCSECGGPVSVNSKGRCRKCWLAARKPTVSIVGRDGAPRPDVTIRPEGCTPVTPGDHFCDWGLGVPTSEDEGPTSFAAFLRWWTKQPGPGLPTKAEWEDHVFWERQWTESDRRSSAA